MNALRNPKSLSSHLRSWLASSLLILVSAFVTFAVGEYLLLSRLPPLLIGTWIVVEGPFEGSSVELRESGVMLSSRKRNGSTERIEGQVRVEDSRLLVTTHDTVTGKATTDVLTILDLSPSQLVTQSEGGEVLFMKRQP